MGAPRPELGHTRAQVAKHVYASTLGKGVTVQLAPAAAGIRAAVGQVIRTLCYAFTQATPVLKVAPPRTTCSKKPSAPRAVQALFCRNQSCLGRFVLLVSVQSWKDSSLSVLNPLISKELTGDKTAASAELSLQPLKFFLIKIKVFCGADGGTRL